MKNFFLSLKTTVWTLFGLVCLFFIGSYMMPMHRAVFAPMNDMLLFQWAEDLAARNPWQTWWFFAVLAGLVVLTINTIVCSLQAIRGRWSRTDFLIRLSPQAVHIGFLFILLAHLLGAGWGYKLSGTMGEGAFARLPEGRVLALRSLDVKTDSAGYTRDWSAEVSLYEDNVVVKSGSLGPNRPLFYHGVGIYLKSLSFEQGPSAFILVNKDPGSLFALTGSIFFMIGAITLLILKWRKP